MPHAFCKRRGAKAGLHHDDEQADLLTPAHPEALLGGNKECVNGRFSPAHPADTDPAGAEHRKAGNAHQANDAGNHRPGALQSGDKRVALAGGHLPG